MSCETQQLTSCVHVKRICALSINHLMSGFLEDNELLGTSVDTMCGHEKKQFSQLG